MSTQQLMEIVNKRGLRIELKDGGPVIVCGDGRREVTDALLAVLKFHREKIIDMLKENDMVNGNGTML